MQPLYRCLRRDGSKCDRDAALGKTKRKDRPAVREDGRLCCTRCIVNWIPLEAAGAHEQRGSVFISRSADESPLLGLDNGFEASRSAGGGVYAAAATATKATPPLDPQTGEWALESRSMLPPKREGLPASSRLHRHTTGVWVFSLFFGVGSGVKSVSRFFPQTKVRACERGWGAEMDSCSFQLGPRFDACAWPAVFSVSVKWPRVSDWVGEWFSVVVTARHRF